jgi:hypothetical protein
MINEDGIFQHIGVHKYDYRINLLYDVAIIPGG